MTKPKWLLLGGETLLGKEIRELVEEGKLPVTLSLASAHPDDIVLAPGEEDLLVMQPLDKNTIEDADVVLLAGTMEAHKRALALAHGLAQRPAMVDAVCDFEDLPESILRAPILERGPVAAQDYSIHSLAHPAAIALARLMSLLHAQRPLRSAVVTVLEPASERGKEGVDELHQQTLTLFNFQQMPRELFDAQVSFNLLPRLGPEAKVNLEVAELRIERHLASLLGPLAVPLPSLRVVQAPVFHGYCLNTWLEFESRPTVDEISGWLKDAGLDVRGADLEPGSNMGVAGQSGLTVSDILEDRGHARGVWLWLALDNMRTRAETALLTAGLLSRKEAR